MRLLFRTARVGMVFAGLFGGGCAHERAAPRPATQGELFVTNEDSNDVSVIDLDHGTVQTVPVGLRPRGVRLSSDGRLLYVAVSGSPRVAPGERDGSSRASRPDGDGIAVFDVERRQVTSRLPCGRDPEAFALAPDGGSLLVSNEEDAQASLVRLPDGARLGTFDTGAEPEGVAIRPDGRIAYVTSEDEGAVYVIDLAEKRVLTSVPVGARPRGVVFTRDGKMALVTSEQGGTIRFLDGQTHGVVGAVKVEAATDRPMGVVLTRDGGRAYVSTGRGGRVLELDVTARRLLRSFPSVGARPWGVALSPDGRFLYSANGPSNDVSVLDLTRGEVVRRFRVGTRPWGLVLRSP